MNKTLLLTVVLVLSLASFAAAQIPQTMSYQGVLTNADGNPVADGTVSLTFKLYDVATDGAALWEETQTLEVKSGIFNAILGSVTNLNLLFDKQYWLGITLDQEAEMTPRITLTASPYSLGATATVTEPAAGQSFVIRNADGDATHELSADGDVLHKGIGTFEGGVKILAGPDTSLIVSDNNGFIFLGPDTSAQQIAGKDSKGTNRLNAVITRTHLGVRTISTPLLTTNRIVADNNGGAIVIEADAKDFGTAVEGKTKDGNGVVGEATGSGAGVSGISRGDGVAVIGSAFGNGDAVVGTAVGTGTGVTGSGNTSYGGWFRSTSGIGLFSHGSMTAAKFEGDVLIEQQGKLKIDDVPAENSDKFLVWGADKFVKFRNLPSSGGGGWLVDPQNNYLISTGHDVLIQDAQGNVTTRFNADGTSIHSGNEVFQDGIEIQSFLDENKVIELNQNGLAIYNRFTGELTTEFLHDGRSLHTGDETFEGDVILTGTNGKGIKLVDAAGNTLAGFGRTDLDTGQRMGVFAKAENPGDLAAVFEGPVDVLGEITASSLHIVNTNGDSLTDFFADGTSRHRGLETYEAGIQVVNSDGAVAIALTPNTDPNSQYALTINGNVQINGMLEAEVKNFRIDHPLDPENMFLMHTSVESPDMKTVYDGVAVLDENGKSMVEMPDWFQALNGDFRYQLTAIGAPAPNIYIAEEVQNNRFTIAGGVHGLKVSWQVTGIRHDAWAKAHRRPLEGYKHPR